MTIYVVYEKNQYSCDPEKDKALFHCSTKAKALKMIKHYLNEKVKNGDFMGAPRFKELDWQYDEKILFKIRFRVHSGADDFQDCAYASGLGGVCIQRAAKGNGAHIPYV